MRSMISADDGHIANETAIRPAVVRASVDRAQLFGLKTHVDCQGNVRSPAGVRLRGSPEGDDREMLAFGMVADRHLHGDAGSRSDEGMGRGTRRPSRPSRARLEAGTPARWLPPEVDLVGGADAEGRVRAVDVVPGQEERDFPTEGGIPEGDEDPPHGLVLQRSDKPLDNGDASMAPNRTESQLEAAFLRPSMKGVCVELRAAIDDEVLGSRLGGPDRAIEESLDSGRGRLLAEDRNSQGAA